MKGWIVFQLAWCIGVATISTRVGVITYHHYMLSAARTASGQFYINSACMKSGEPGCIKAAGVHHFNDVILPTSGWILLVLIVGIGCLIGVRRTFGPLMKQLEQLSKEY